ncbi:hypothetical protein [Kushneria sinocarnis]|uniref:hypothetical protein n=1 Tax=Kushneria sinocarnis TaxID=595502 RepID=UPI001474F262|nr:hypothetical protein [Kushneria sinocarnis]
MQRPLAGGLETDFCLLTPREQPLSQLAREFVTLFEREYDRVIVGAGAPARA